MTAQFTASVALLLLLLFATLMLVTAGAGQYAAFTGGAALLTALYIAITGAREQRARRS